MTNPNRYAIINTERGETNPNRKELTTMKTYYTLTSSTGTELVRTTKLETLVAKMFSFGTHNCGIAKREQRRGTIFNKVITKVTLPEAGYGETREQYLARLTTILSNT